MSGPCETRIMTAVLARLMKLEEQGQPIVVWRQNVGSAFDKKTGRKIDFGEAGQSDIMCIVKRGTFVAIETKSESGKQSEKQKNWEKRVVFAGAVYYVADTIDGAVAPVLDLLGLAGRATWCKNHWEILG